MSVNGKRVPLLLVCAVLVLSTFITAFRGQPVYADQIDDRTLTLSSSSPEDELASPTTTYTFTFSVPQSTVIESVGIEICEEAAGGTCTTPTGFSNTTGAATLASQPTNLGDGSGWTIDNGTAGELRIVNDTNSSAPTGSQTIVFDEVQNPTTANQAFYGRITTYSDDTWTTAIDTGTVAASTAEPIILTGTMPESLIFCTGETIDVNASDVPQCSTASSGDISFNQLFSPEATAWATSQMAASTNASAGYAITVSGSTLMNGATPISAIGGTASTSSTGTGQFGMNLVDNDSDTTIGSGSPNPISYYDDTNAPADGDVYPVPNNDNYRGQPKGAFATATEFAFDATASNIVAASDNLTAGPTDSQRFTATYIVNVSGGQLAGTYTTTLTYICTPTF
jgi:hypothetical protein